MLGLFGVAEGRRGPVVANAKTDSTIRFHLSNVNVTELMDKFVAVQLVYFAQFKVSSAPLPYCFVKHNLHISSMYLVLIPKFRFDVILQSWMFCCRSYLKM